MTDALLAAVLFSIGSLTGLIGYFVGLDRGHSQGAAAERRHAEKQRRLAEYMATGVWSNGGSPQDLG